MNKKSKRRPLRQAIRLGRFKILQKNIDRFHWDDLYHHLFTMPLPQLFGLITLAFLLINMIFAGAYLLGGDCIENAQPGSFSDAFFFSVQTLATIGYGAMYPRTAYANTLVVIEVFLGLLGVAIATGLMFSRFSQPTARVLFSRIAVICPYNKVPTLMFRAANQRSNLIVEAEVKVSLLMPEITPEGHTIRRLQDLKLARSRNPLFILSWLVMHPIDENSPLYHHTATTLQEKGAQLIITLNGLDETVMQTLHARQIYLASEILWDYKFVDVVTSYDNGDRAIDYTHFHNVVPFENP
ncbi:MAG: ion channel [Jaaginema sp. PMC 1079.18]|nr:ion channel [Jaaginema sp. PMC 1080.18]MEC4849433.1 ion channel [Jaaginema sp. PMC 1079.18]MEC4864935.1 ion channel [Jaaginema sp. PMC 1078.18]